MKTARLLIAFLALACFAFAPAQVPSGQRADEIMTKIRQLELVNHVVALLLTKEQASKILGALEKTRQEVRKTQAEELEILKKLEPKLDEALKAAYEKREIPAQELFREIAARIQAMRLKRKAVADENIASVLKVVNETLDAGQKKAAAGALNIKALDPTRDPDKMSEEEKVRFFVEVVLMDPVAYDVLVKMPRAEKS